MGIEVVVSPAARLVIVEKAVMQAEGLAFADLAPDSELDRLLLVIDPQREAASVVVLSKICGRERVTGGQVGFLIQQESPAGHRAVDVSLVGLNGWAVIGGGGGPGVLVGKRGGKEQPAPGSQGCVERDGLRFIGARQQAAAR